MRKHLPLLIGSLFTFVTAYLLVRDVNWAALQQYLQTAQYIWLIPAFLALTLGLWVRGMRWRALLMRVPRGSDLFWITNIGYLASNTLPFRLGELVRVYLLSETTPAISFSQAFATGVLERLIDILMVFGLMLLALPFAPAQNTILVGARWLALIAFLAMLVFFVLSWQGERVANFVEGLVGKWNRAVGQGIANQLRPMFAGIRALTWTRWLEVLAWSVAIWIVSALSMHLVLLAFFPTAQWYESWFATGATALGLGLPSLPSGVGVYEAAVVAALGLFGYTEYNQKLAYALVIHILNFAVIAIWGLVGLNILKVNFGKVVQQAQLLGRKLQQSPPK